HEPGESEERFRGAGVVRAFLEERIEAVLRFADQADAGAFVGFVVGGVQLAPGALEGNLVAHRLGHTGLVVELVEEFEGQIGHALLAQSADEVERSRSGSRLRGPWLSGNGREAPWGKQAGGKCQPDDEA